MSRFGIGRRGVRLLGVGIGLGVMMAPASAAPSSPTTVTTTTTAGPAVWYSNSQPGNQGMPYWQFTVRVVAADGSSLAGDAVDDYVAGPTSSDYMGGMCTPLSTSGTSTCRIFASFVLNGQTYGGYFPATGAYLASKSSPRYLPPPSP